MTQPNKTAVFPAEPSVLIEGQPAVIAGRSTDNNVTPVSGEPMVLIANHPAATLSVIAPDNRTSQEHLPVSGKPTVLIGNRPATSQ